jgi:mono/diheme cytochrome c family protein
MKGIECALAVAAIVSVLSIAGQAQNTTTLTGNAERGKALFTGAFRCASCHGTTAESGSPRLLPVRRTQAEFIAYVQKPTANAMPTYGDQSAQALADVYAYLRSLKEPSPPPAQNIPLLNEVLKTIP